MPKRIAPQFVDQARRSSQSGFSRIDLAVASAVICGLAFLEVAALSSTRAASQSSGCLDNLQAMTRAIHQFDFDNHFLPPNPDDGNATPGFNWVPGNAGRGGAQEFDAGILTRSALFSYLNGKGTTVFRCPDDLRQGVYQGTDPAQRGSIVPSARSYSMNVAVGSNPYVRTPGTPTDGAWLDNVHAHTRNKTWRTYGRFDDIVDPAPAGLAVFLDEDSDSLNDGVFGFGMQAEEWIDWPGTRHDGGGSIGYADGHAELKRWVDPRTVVQSHKVSRLKVPGSADYQWLKERISARRALDRTLIVPRSEGVPVPDVKLVWPAKSGVNYRVETTEDFQNWKTMEGKVQVSGTEASVTDASPRSNSGKFYRILSDVP